MNEQLSAKDYAEFEMMQDASRNLSVVIDGIPGWLADALGLTEAVDRLDNAVIEDDAE